MALKGAHDDFDALKKYQKLRLKIPKIPVVRYVEGEIDYFAFPFLIIQYYPAISLLELLKDPTITEKKELEDLFFRLNFLPDNE